MRKICTKRLGLGFPTQAAPYYTRRDLPTLTLTTFRPNCEMGLPAPFGRARPRESCVCARVCWGFGRSAPAPPAYAVRVG